MVAPHAGAADVTWDLSPGVAGPGDGAITGGSGSWDESFANWTTDGGLSNVVWNPTGTDTAIFGGAVGTVMLTTDYFTVGGLTFNDNLGYRLSGGLLTFGAAGAITTNVDAEVASFLTGVASITKAGAGKLTLSGFNTYTGTTHLNSGVLNLGAPEIADDFGPLGTSAAANPGSIILNGGTLQYSTVNTNDYSGRFSTAADQAYLVDTNGQNVVWATALTSSGGTLTKIGAGTLTLTAPATYTGATLVTGGILALDLNSAVGDNVLPATTTLTLGGGGSLNVIGAGGIVPRSQTINGTIFNAGAATITPTLAATSTTANVLTLDLGPLTRATGGTGNIVFTTGNTTATNTQLTSPTGTAGALITDANGVAFLTFGTTSSAIRDWAVKGAGNIQILPAPITGFYNTTWAATPGVSIPNANIEVGANSPTLTPAIVGDNAVTSIRFDDAGGRTLTLNNSGTGASSYSVGGILVTSNVGNNPTLLNGTGTLRGPSGGAGDLIIHNWDTTNTATVGLPIGGSGGFTKSGPGIVNLTAANTYTGPTTITAGTLRVGNNTATGDLGHTTGPIVNHGILQFARSDTALTIPNDITGSGSLSTDASFTGTVTLNGAINLRGLSGGNAITIDGSGTNPSGYWNVNGTLATTGTVELKHNTTLNLGSITNSAARMTITSASLILDNSGGSGASTLNVYGTLNLINSGTTLGNANSGAEALLQIKSGGVVNIAVGRLVMAGAANAGNNWAKSGTLTLDPGSALTLDNTDAGEGFVLQSGGSASLTTGTGTVNLNGGILTTGRVIKVSGRATAIFNFNGGILKPTLSSPNFLNLTSTSAGSHHANSRANVRNGGAIINTNGHAIAIPEPLVHSNIGGDNAVDGGLTLNDTAASKGTLTLTGTSTYTGLTTLSAGTTLRVGDGISDGSIQTTSGIVNHGALTFDFAGSQTYNGITGPGSLTKNGSGTLTLGGTTPGFTGDITVVAGRLNLAGILGANITINDGATLGGEGSIGGTFTLQGNNTLIIDPTTPAALQAAGAVTIAGPTTVTLSAIPITAGPHEVIKYGTLAPGSVEKLSTDATGMRNPSFADDPANARVTFGFTTAIRTWSGADWIWNLGMTSAWIEGDQQFYLGDMCVFDDTATGNTEVLVTDTVTPGSVTFNNTTKNYILDGGAITGLTGLTKTGTGTVTVNNLNTFTGQVRIQAGTLSVATINNDSAAGPLGNSALAVSLGNTGGETGTLELTGSTATTSKKFTLAAGGTGSFQVDDSATNLTLSGLIDGTGTLAKTGPGTLTLAGANSGFTGATVVNGGTLILNNSYALGTIPGTITNNAVLSIASGIAFGVSGAFNGAAGTFANAGTTNFYSGSNAALGTFISNGGTTTIRTGSSVRATTATLVAGAVTASTVPLTVTTSAQFKGVIATLGGGGTSFGIKGADIVSPSSINHRVLMLSGGTLTLSIPTLPTAGLVAKWTFDYGTANDSSGNGYHGTAVGSPTFDSVDVGVSGGKCLVLTGSNYVSVDTGDSQAVFDGGGAMTISAWVKGWPGTWSPFVSKNGEPNGWQLRKSNTSTNLAWTTRGVSNEDMTSTTTAASNGAWHLVTMTYDSEAGANNKRIYVDGLLDSQATATGTISASPNMMLFGARDIGTIGSFFTGRLDDIYFFNRALTASEAISLYPVATGTTDIAATASSQVSLPAGTITLGNLILTAGTSPTTLTLQDTTGVTLGGISATGTSGTSAIVTGAPTLNIARGGSVSVGTGVGLTLQSSLVGTTGLTKTGAGALTLAAANTHTGNTTVSAGALTLAATGGLKFLVTNTTTNKVTGAGTATFGGTFTIDTSAVSNPTGSWTLVDVATKSYGATFTLGGEGWSKTGSVWTKPAGTKTWTFTESTGVLALTSVSGYDTWAAAKGLTSQNNGPTQDPDGDGRANLLEYAFDGNPLSAADKGKVYVLTADSDVDPDSTKELLLTIAVRAGTPAFSGTPSPKATQDGITYTIEGSTSTLTSFPTQVNVVPTAVTTNLPAPNVGYEYRSFSLSGSNGLLTKGFLRAKVTLP